MIAQRIDYSETRQAAPDEEERMSGPVLWMYQRGQAVILWKMSGLISLAPESLPRGQVIRLQKSGYDRCDPEFGSLSG
jgi:hypothetical protein